MPVDGSRGIALMGLGIGRQNSFRIATSPHCPYGVGDWEGLLAAGAVRLIEGLVRPYRAEMNGGPETQGVALGLSAPKYPRAEGPA